jgi:hypothetical protein
MPASPRLIAGLSSSASAGPIGCTSGLEAFEFEAFEFEAFEFEALEFGALDFGALPGFLGFSGFFAMAGIWGESGGEKRADWRLQARFIDRQPATFAGRSRFSDSGKHRSTQALMAC